MGQFIEDLQYKIKKSSGSALLKIFLISIGFIVGMTFALIGQQMIGYGWFSYVLVIVATLLIFHRVSRGWTWGKAIVFTIICVLLATLLNMYIRLAPGA